MTISLASNQHTLRTSDAIASLLALTILCEHKNKKMNEITFDGIHRYYSLVQS